MQYDDASLEAELQHLIAESFPGMVVRVEPPSEDDRRRRVFFIHESFRPLYTLQRWHAIRMPIPFDFQGEHLEDTCWFELAPGENPEDLRYPDMELVESITPDVLRSLVRSGFFDKLHDAMCTETQPEPHKACHNDLSISQSILAELGYPEEAQWDALHVLMNEGGFCDCEVLYNVDYESLTDDADEPEGG